MHTRVRLAAAAAVVLLPLAAHAQTADDVVEKYLTAIGGRAALGKLTSRTMTGTITVATPQGNLSGPIEIYNQAPNKARSLIKLDLSSLGAGEMTVDQRFDGTSGYVIDTLQGNREITGGMLDNLKNASFPSPLLNYKEHGATVELAGREKVGDRDAFVLVLKPKAGSPSRQFIDAESYLPLKVIVKLDVPQFGEVEQSSEFSDYREVDGVKVPFAVRSTSAVQSSTVVLSKVEHNAKFDDKMFARP